MSNIKHNKCPMRTLASEAKARLASGGYRRDLPPVPKNATPQQREIYLKLCELRKGGENIENPIALFADKQKLSTLTHEERQRYIMQISADYLSMRTALDSIVLNA
ncbi:MAG: hypothetical protein K2J16_05490 [Clostridia bacterium]|nr:hypothetical protein [Clostridia bacterium]